jgi:hypothetical protein
MRPTPPLESQLRRLRRERVPGDLRARALAAARQQTSSTGPHKPRKMPTSAAWRFAMAAASLAIVVAACVWYVAASRPSGDAPRVVAVGGTAHRPVAPPGDDTVVFWVDDDTPVFVNLLEEK